MRIRVIFVDGAVGEVSAAELDEMLGQKLVVAFWRTSGQVVVGRDDLRHRNGDEGSWRDRRKSGLPTSPQSITAGRVGKTG